MTWLAWALIILIVVAIIWATSKIPITEKYSDLPGAIAMIVVLLLYVFFPVGSTYKIESYSLDLYSAKDNTAYVVRRHSSSRYDYYYYAIKNQNTGEIRQYKAESNNSSVFEINSTPQLKIYKHTGIEHAPLWNVIYAKFADEDDRQWITHKYEFYVPQGSFTTEFEFDMEQ